MSVLVNFRMSDHLKVGLDHIADMKHTTKTSIINDLITTYVRSEYRQYITDRELVRKIVKKNKPVKTKSVNEISDEPLSFVSSTEDDSYDTEDW